MKEKIICIPAEGKEEEIRGYHYFKLQESNDNLLLFCAYGGMNFIRKYLEFDASFHFPIQKMPEVVKAMTDAFYLCNPWEPGKDNGFGVELEDSYFSASLEFADWMPSPYFMDCFFIAQRNFREDEKEIHETITLRWDADTMEKVPLKGTRVMPKSLAALIKGLRDFYNEWQKGHLEFERMK